MAFYSVDIMERLSLGVLTPRTKNDAITELLAYKAGHVADEIPLLAHPTIDMSEGLSTLYGQSVSLTDESVLPAWHEPLSANATSGAPIAQEGGELFLRLSGFFKTKVLNALYDMAVDPKQVGAPTLLITLRTLPSSSYEYHPLIKLSVALKDRADADIPENWKVSKRPDIRIEYDRTAPDESVVCLELKLPVADVLCHSDRYKNEVVAWRTPMNPPVIPYLEGA